MTLPEPQLLYMRTSSCKTCATWKMPTHHWLSTAASWRSNPAPPLLDHIFGVMTLGKCFPEDLTPAKQLPLSSKAPKGSHPQIRNSKDPENTLNKSQWLLFETLRARHHRLYFFQHYCRISHKGSSCSEYSITFPDRVPNTVKILAKTPKTNKQKPKT